MVPRSVRGPLRATIESLPLVPLPSDLTSLAGLWRLGNSAARWAPGAQVPVRLRALGGESVRVRPRTTDRYALEATFRHAYHLPPSPVAREHLRLIWDLGANIGLTVAHLAVRYPGARILGVELDPQNAVLCRANIAPWRDRCELIEGAVWPYRGRFAYASERGDVQGFRIVSGAPTEDGCSAEAIPLSALAERLVPNEIVDYVKMDIEGAEREVLRVETGWAERVRSIKVEVHAPYDVAGCVSDLRALGFATRVDEVHGAAVEGVRAS